MSCVPIEIIPNQTISVMVGTASYLPQKGTVFYYNFAFGDASHSIYNLLENEVLLSVWVDFQEAFDGNGTVTVGTQLNQSLFMNVSQNNPQSAEIYEVNPLYQATETTGIYIFINPDGETQGSGIIYLLVG
jgi:hypothetical protein